MEERITSLKINTDGSMMAVGHVQSLDIYKISMKNSYEVLQTIEGEVTSLDWS